MQSVLDILEWPKVLDHLESCCQTGYGRVLVTHENLQLPGPQAIRQAMQQVEEVKVLIQRYGDLSIPEPPDILGHLRILEKDGDIHTAEALGEILAGLKRLRQLVRFFIQHRSSDATPLLVEILEPVTLPNPAIEYLETLVSEKGELQDSATPEYERLTRQVLEQKAAIRQHLHDLMRRPAIAKCLQENIVTERDGRSVLPVRAEHKVDVPGIVHGASASGVTLYIEPRSVVEQNNRLVALQGQLAQEIRRILHQASQTLHPQAPDLLHFVEHAAQLDLLLAKARQSLILKANPVELVEAPGHLHLRQARHPLLMLNLEHVVPNNIELSPPHRVMLITGPNTGGKTVLLKLLGLFSLMCRAGLHVPAAEGSRMSLFEPVLADIGDPQSIAQNLSTFSGHIARLRAFLQESDLSRALILVDEICAGTDPQEGSALAKALLDAFYRRGATVVVTTHLGDLKVTAHQHEGFLNACVEFDAESLSPTYRLIIGMPGTSNALNIAARLGIPPEVIESARAQLSQPASESAQLIESLEQKNLQLSQELEEARRLREEVQWEEEQLRKQLNRLEGEKKKTLQLYRDGLRDKLRVIEREMEDLKKTIASPRKKDRNTLQQVAGRFRKIQEKTGEIFVEETQKLYPHPGLDWEQLRVGDQVTSRSLSLTGTVTEKHPTRQEVTIQAGMIKTTIPFSDIIRRETPAPASGKSSTSGKSGNVYPQPKRNTLFLECDVRGMSRDEAIALVEKFIDDALVSNISTVEVIHGQGTGALKKAIRSHLRELPFVKGFGPADARSGGDGKTIIQL